jgi:O-acetyl-ADP-ribose deacetylase (regulator of RNase III)
LEVAAMEKSYRIGEHEVVLEVGDITQEYTDGMGSSAPPSLAGATGVDVAIHRAAGPEIRKACDDVLKTLPGGAVPIGEAVATRAFRLRNKYILHCVAPKYQGDDTSRALLAGCYRSALALCRKLRLRSIAFPAIGAGSRGFPAAEAATIALAALREDLAENAQPQTVKFLFRDERVYQAFVTEADASLERG